jgi:hypothetical protein
MSVLDLQVLETATEDRGCGWNEGGSEISLLLCASEASVLLCL